MCLSYKYLYMAVEYRGLCSLTLKNNKRIIVIYTETLILIRKYTGDKT